MTTTLTSIPAPVWLRDLADARARYEELLGWPVSVQVGRRDLVIVAGSAISAITMPAPLGATVRQELTIALLCGPIIADPGGTWWTFLTQPAGLIRPDVAHDLAAVRARITPRGGCVEVPPHPTTTSLRTWRWVEPPIPNRPLPPGSVVISTIRRLSYDGHLAA